MTNTPKRLVLIDGHAIIHRAYHALPPLHSSGGQQANAVYGFISMLLKVINDLKPKYLVVTFDLPVPTFRHEAYIGYQATRRVMEDDLKGQIEIVIDTVDSSGIAKFTAAGFEADDVIGTLAKQAVRVKGGRGKGERGVDEVIIVTGDRDMLQLVTGKVKVYAPIKGLTETRIFDRKAVEEHIGLRPEQIVDYKALIGDASDNYPGVPGIGPKTAVGLLKKYGKLENIYKALGTGNWALGERIAEKLRIGYESGVLSKKLAKISQDAPIELDLEKAEFKELENNERFISKLKELGFKSLVKRLTGEPSFAKASEGKGRKGKTGGQMDLV